MPTTTSTKIARSSQVRSTERRDGKSMEDVVMDDMVLVTRRPLWPR